MLEMSKGIDGITASSLFFFRGLVSAITHMLIDLGINSRTVYEDDFEKPFLETSANFYRLESQEFIASNSCSEYMKKVPIKERSCGNRTGDRAPIFDDIRQMHQALKHSNNKERGCAAAN